MLHILEEYHDKGLVFKQTHPTLDLTIWNYTPMVQYERLWDDITLQCRGLVTNSEGKIIARPFKKFFNYEEHKSEDVPNENYAVYEKMDGSLGILFYYAGQWIMATRGSFTSPQAIKGTELLSKYDGLSDLFKSYTYLFEIIYPENRIVVDYNGEEKLVLIGAIETDTGIEDDITIYSHYGFDVVTLYKTWGETYDLLKKEIPNDKEGYVIAFKNGFRMKIKGVEYIRLHQILTETSSRDIWECLKNNKSLDEILDEVPDEFYTWVKETVNGLQTQFDSIKLEVENEFKELINKKEYADKIKDNKNRHFLFKRLDSYSQQLDDMIWDSIYPPYTKPFTNIEK
jgi:RNA ligase